MWFVNKIAASGKYISAIAIFAITLHAHAEISVSNDTISWPDDGWYQVQRADNFSSICEGVSECAVSPGEYIVINHTTNQRWEGVLVLGGNAPTVVGNTISWAGDDWLQVQRADNFVSMCEGGNSCTVPSGNYIVVNHTTKERWENITVRSSGKPTVQGDTMVFPNDDWYQVQDSNSLVSICEGRGSCQTGPGEFLVINLTTGERIQNIIVSDATAEVTREARTYDGTNNNRDNQNWGASLARLQRIGEVGYSDGIASMIFTDRAGAREISNTIVQQAEDENLPNAFGTSDMLWQWGQFIDHDVGLTGGSTDEEQNIAVPVGDPFFDPNSTGTVVIPFNRAINDPDTGTDTSNPREQENEITSWIDGSMVYGSDDERAAVLREGSDSPFLATSPGNLLPFNTNNLPNANDTAVPDPKSLFIAGDIRANEQAGLAAMHTLWLREHNRLAANLSDENPDADADDVFEAARRLVIAKIQIVTYNEFLPALLGAAALPSYTGYNASINPTLFNEFSAAAFRLGHSMVSDDILLIGPDGEPLPQSPLELRDAFFTAPQVLAEEGGIDSILRGLASKTHQSIDIMVIHTLRNLLFGAPGAGGLDLISLNIQRGRDHGLPPYNAMRRAMGLEPVTSFDQISNNAEINQSLQDAYGDVENIDLWIGGLSETPLSDQGSQLGSLFHAIIVKQFTDLRDGDRFWYENYLDTGELQRVANTTLAEVIRANTGIRDEIQNNVFFAQ